MSKKQDYKDLVLPHGEFFKAAWADWVQDRADRKIPLTYNAAKRQLTMLASVTEDEAIEMIDRSINNGWRGIFKLNNWKSPQQKPSLYI